jgi:hypothetical protein
MKYKLTFKAESEITIEIDAVNKFHAEGCAELAISSMIDPNNILRTDNRVKFLHPLMLTTCERDFSPIMNPYNAHNVELVDKINELWKSDKHDRFRIILVAYMQRDLNEMYDKNIFGEASDEKTEWFFNNNVDTAYLDENWEDLAGDYLMRVADDADLECIIDFIR